MRVGARKYPPVKCRVCGVEVGLTFLTRHMKIHHHPRRKRGKEAELR